MLPWREGDDLRFCLEIEPEERPERWEEVCADCELREGALRPELGLAFLREAGFKRDFVMFSISS